MVRQYKQRVTTRAPKYDIERPLRYVDSANLLPREVVHEDLSVRHVHISLRVHRHALAASLRKRL